MEAMYNMLASYSPICSRSSYTPSSQGATTIQYFNSNQTHDAQMWSASGASTATALPSVVNDDYGSPKSGTLPGFQRLTSSSNLHYAPTTARTLNTFNYGTQVRITIYI